MKIKEIAQLIERTAPKSLAYPWDNVGLLVGDEEQEIEKILVTLDVNLFTVKEAIRNGCNLILSHHPILFGGIKKIDFGTPVGEMLRLLIQNHIAVYAAHTNMDTAPHGINARLAELFGLENVRILEFHTERSDAGLGRYGQFRQEITAQQLCALTKKKLHTPGIRIAGSLQKPIQTLCIASGSCAESIKTAIEKGCDAVITGDLKYHETMNYAEQGIFIIDAGHYPTETIVMDIFSDILENTHIPIVRSENPDTFVFL